MVSLQGSTPCNLLQVVKILSDNYKQGKLGGGIAYKIYH